MKFEKYMMTPERAAAILDRTSRDPSFSNRKMRVSQVKSIARQIKDGLWIFTHQAIALDKHGVCLDGQHRLAAIVEAGIAVYVTLATDCDRESFRVIDCGIKRTYADRVHLSSDQIFNARAVALSRAYVNYGKGLSSSLVNIEDVENAYLELKDGIDAVARRYTSKVRGITRFDAGAAIASYIVKEPARGHDFLDLWYSGARLPSGSPILIMREAFLSGRVSNGADAYWRMVRATQAHFSGKDITRIQPATSDWMGNERGTSALQAEKRKNRKDDKKNGKKKDDDQ